MKTFLHTIKLYFSNLTNYIWADDNGRIVCIMDTSWFWGFSIYPLVTYFYVNEAYTNEFSGLHIVSRSEFISIMHTL